MGNRARIALDMLEGIWYYESGSGGIVPDSEDDWRCDGRSEAVDVSTTAKMLGVAIPVVLASTFCLSVPFILILADVALLAGALVAFFSGRSAPEPIPTEDLPELE